MVVGLVDQNHQLFLLHFLGKAVERGLIDAHVSEESLWQVVHLEDLSVDGRWSLGLVLRWNWVLGLRWPRA